MQKMETGASGAAILSSIANLRMGLHETPIFFFNVLLEDDYDFYHFHDILKVICNQTERTIMLESAYVFKKC